MIVEANKISKLSLLYVLLAGIGLGSLLFSVILGIRGELELMSITIESEIELGSSGFIRTMTMWPIFAFVWTLLTWLMTITGLWLLRKIWSLKLVMVEAAEDEPASTDFDGS